MKQSRYGSSIDNKNTPKTKQKYSIPVVCAIPTPDVATDTCQIDRLADSINGINTKLDYIINMLSLDDMK